MWRVGARTKPAQCSESPRVTSASSCTGLDRASAPTWNAILPGGGLALARDPELLHPAAQRTRMQVQQTRRAIRSLDDPGGPLQHGEDVAAFHFFECGCVIEYCALRRRLGRRSDSRRRLQQQRIDLQYGARR